MMPRKSLLIKTVQRECRNNYEAYQDQIFFDSGPEDKNHILLLGHQDLIRELNTDALWFVNGTLRGPQLLPCLSSTIPLLLIIQSRRRPKTYSLFLALTLYFPSILWVISLWGDFVPWVIFGWVILSFG